MALYHIIISHANLNQGRSMLIIKVNSLSLQNLFTRKTRINALECMKEAQNIFKNPYFVFKAASIKIYT